MQQHLQRREDMQTAQWLRQNGICATTFASTPIQLLQAQQAAHHLLKHHCDLLSLAQIKQLKAFIQRMGSTQARQQLNLAQAYSILNISNKVNRRLFRQYRKIKT